MTRSQRILVVGAGGFIGRHVLARLKGARVSVAALDLYRPSEAPEGIEWIVGSASDTDLLRTAVRGCDTVIFLAANSLPASANADIAAEVSSHVQMVVRSAEICILRGVKRFVFASSGGTVYGHPNSEFLGENHRTEPLNAYGVSKMAIEHYLRVMSSLRGMKTISLRVSNPFGPGQRASQGQGFIAAALSAAVSGNVLQCWGDGSTIRDFLFIEDVASAFVKSCEYEGPFNTFNIGSGVGRSLRSVIGDIEEVTTLRVQVEYTARRAIDVPRNVLDISRAATSLYWRPLVPFRVGLKHTAEWWAQCNKG